MFAIWWHLSTSNTEVDQVLNNLAKLQVKLGYYAGDLGPLQAVASSVHLTLSDNITVSGAGYRAVMSYNVHP